MKRFLSNHPRQRPQGSITGAAVLAATALLCVISAAALLSPLNAQAKVPAATAVIIAKPAAIQSCTGCHTPTLIGRPGFSPSLHKSGILTKYTKATFERVMNTGETWNKQQVRPPMPVYHYTAAQSDKIFKYLKTLP